jgi:putative membrane protein
MIVLGLGLLVTTACSQETPNDDSADTGQNMAQTQPLNTDGTVTNVDTPTFVRSMAASDMFEIDSSNLALRKATSDEVKRFAQQMIDAHTASSAKLKSLVGAATTPMEMPTMLPAEKKAIVERLEATGADAFDMAYMDAQLTAHREALRMLQDYSARGTDADLRAFATEMVAPVSAHLEMAQKLAKTPA